MKILSWNVNGIRAVIKNGFASFLNKFKPDIIALQEIKISDEVRAQQSFDFKDYQEFWHSAVRPGYSGTAVFFKPELSSKKIGLDIEEFDSEGRVQTLDFGKYYLINVYFPNAGHGLPRLPFRLDFNNRFLKYVKRLDKIKPVIICGDFNVAHQEIDLANPRSNIGNPGFTYEEKAWTDRLIRAGFVDSFRFFHKNKVQYSWWSYRYGARERNIGWRIDYFFVSRRFIKNIKNSFILDKIKGSDHCPVGIEL